MANDGRFSVATRAAMTVFVDPLARAFDDPDHSHGEQQALLIGRSLPGRLLVGGARERADTIRIISARKATPRERRDYEADA